MYETATNGRLREILESVIEAIGGAAGVLALVRGYARVGKSFDGSMHQALQHTAVEEQPIPGSSAYNLHPVSAASLRKELFGLMHDADHRVAAVTEACLSSIDDLRDRYGTVESEPRHPDVASGKPWPREAREPATGTGGSEIRTLVTLRVTHVSCHQTVTPASSAIEPSLQLDFSRKWEY